MIRHFVQVAVHRFWVAYYIFKFCARMLWRAQVHDLSKYGKYERRRFAEALPKLRASSYGSDEYDRALDRLGPALKHHYAANSHHPEHYGERGVEGMDLYDFVEMYCDWKAAIRKHADGDLRQSISHNADRFDLDRQVIFLLASTAAMDGH